MNPVQLIISAVVIVFLLVSAYVLSRSKKCPKCGTAMDWNDDYDKWVCPSCGKTMKG